MSQLRQSSIRQDTFFQKGLQFQEDNKYEDAINCFDRVIKSKNNTAEALNNKGVCLLELNKTEDAIVCFTESIRQHEENVSAYNNKGVAHSKLKQYEEAVKAYDKALQYGASPSSINANIGIDFQMQNKYNQAELYFARAIAVDRQNSNLYMLRAKSLLDLDKKEEALKTYLQVISEIDDNNIEALNAIGVLYNEIGQGEEGLKYLYRVLSLSKEETETISNIGIILMSLKRYEEAIPYFSEVLSRNQASLFSTLIHRARAYFYLGIIEKAEQDIMNAFQEVQKEIFLQNNEQFNKAKQEKTVKGDTFQQYTNKEQQQQKQQHKNNDQLKVFLLFTQLEQQLMKLIEENNNLYQKFPESKEYLERNGNIYLEEIKRIICEKKLEILTEYDQKDFTKIQHRPMDTKLIDEFIQKLSDKMKKNETERNQSIKYNFDFLYEQIDQLQRICYPEPEENKIDKDNNQTSANSLSFNHKNTLLLLQTEAVKKEITQLKQQLKIFSSSQEEELLVYTQVFYWSSLNMFLIYLKMYEEITENPNQPDLINKILQNEGELKNEIINQQQYLQVIDSSNKDFKLNQNLSPKKTPLLQEVVSIIMNLIQEIVYDEPGTHGQNDLQLQNKTIHKLAQIILNKFMIEKSISIKLAQVAYTQSDLKRIHILYSQDETPQPTVQSREFIDNFEKKISEIQGRISSILQIEKHHHRGVRFAIRDIVLMLSYMLKNSDQTIRLQQTPISKIVTDLHISNAFEGLLLAKQNKLNIEQSHLLINSSVNDQKKSIKRNSSCQCIIF